MKGSPMLLQTRLVMAGVLTAVMLAGSSRAADLTESLKMGTPDIKSAGPLAFGEDRSAGHQCGQLGNQGHPNTSTALPVMAKGEAEGPYRVGPMELWVPRAFEVQARMLLEDAASSEGS